MEIPKKALILVAGRGKRLMPITESMPKCMAEINDKPILQNTLEALSKNSIEEVIIVVGYMKNVVKDKIGNTFNGMKITYVDNDVYNITNTMYSLWLAKKWVENSNFLFIEGDMFIEHVIINRLISQEKEDVIVVDEYNENAHGLCVIPSSENTVKKMILTKDQGEGFVRSGKLKTVNVYKLSSSFSQKIFNRIKKTSEEERMGEFYDIILADMLNEQELQLNILNINGLKWYEVDTLEDLKSAQEVFRLENTSHNEDVGQKLG